MSLPALLLLSLLAVQCGGCTFEIEGVRNIKATIDSNPTGFRSVFPKDYYVEHYYSNSMLCDDPCCVFPAAIVLLDSWRVLFRNLWAEHLNHSLILELKHALVKIIEKNNNTEIFQQVTDLAQFSQLQSSPEELLRLTSELFEKWIKVGCSSYVRTCALPTLPPSVERRDYARARARLLTTRAVNGADDEPPDPDPADESAALSGSGPPPPSPSVSMWSPLLFRLYWWLLP